MKFFGFRPKIQKWNLKKALHYFAEIIETNPLMYNIKYLEQKRTPAIAWLFVWIFFHFLTTNFHFGQKNKWKQAFHLFVELVKTNPLMYNINHLG